MASTSCATVTVASPLAEDTRAVMVATPAPAAVTSPVVRSAVATVGRRLAQVTDTPVITLPYWSRTSAVNCSESPIAVNVTDAGEMVSVVGVGGSGGGVGSPPHAPRRVTKIRARSREPGLLESDLVCGAGLRHGHMSYLPAGVRQFPSRIAS